MRHDAVVERGGAQDKSSLPGFVRMLLSKQAGLVGRMTDRHFFPRGNSTAR
jgi:hypothetical protein